MPIRKALGVGPGDTISFDVTDEGIRVRPQRRPGAFEKWEGRYRVGRGLTAAQFDKWLRTLRGHDEE